MTWRWPLREGSFEVPRSPHPGAFGAVRRYDRHTGVDLYANVGEAVQAVEDGLVVKVGIFTGSEVGSPWWNTTWAVMVEGASGVVLYGEVDAYVRPVWPVKAGSLIGRVKRVLRSEANPEIPGHLPSMLHMELYRAGTRKFAEWKLGEPQPESLIDPTPLLWR